MTELAAARMPVTVTRRVLQPSRQPYHRWLTRPVSDAEAAQAYRANALFDAHRRLYFANLQAGCHDPGHLGIDGIACGRQLGGTGTGLGLMWGRSVSIAVNSSAFIRKKPALRCPDSPSCTS